MFVIEKQAIVFKSQQRTVIGFARTCCIEGISIYIYMNYWRVNFHGGIPLKQPQEPEKCCFASRRFLNYPFTTTSSPCQSMGSN